MANAFRGRNGRDAATLPVLMEITIENEYNYFIIDREEYSPYYLTEKAYMMQDGICLHVKSVEHVMVPADGEHGS